MKVTNEPKEARMSRWLLALLAFATLAVGTIATSGAAGTSDDSGNELAGTWVAVVNRPAPLPQIRSLRVFTDTGSFVESGSDGFSTQPAVRRLGANRRANVRRCRSRWDAAVRHFVLHRGVP